MSKLSEKGINLIKSYEGLKLIAYKYPAGKWAIGYGTRIIDPHTKKFVSDDIKFEDLPIKRITQD